MTPLSSKRERRERQVSQPYLNVWEGDEANPPENHLQTQESQEIDGD